METGPYNTARWKFSVFQILNPTNIPDSCLLTNPRHLDLYLLNPGDSNPIPTLESLKSELLKLFPLLPPTRQPLIGTLDRLSLGAPSH